MSAIYDNWERLVAAVVKKQQLWELFHDHSRSPSFLSEASDFSSSFDSRSPLDDLASDFSRLNSSSAYRRTPKMVFFSDFSPAIDIKDVCLASSELLGSGTFGSSYAATMDNGVRIVVKRLNSTTSISETEFNRHMTIVGGVKHENVAALRAYYASEDERLMLYDYHTRGSVFALLHGLNGERQARVDWGIRLRIAVGAARGIAEIHMLNNGKLAHGNIKASNVFRNPDEYGCVSDLGPTNFTTKITSFLKLVNRKNSIFLSSNFAGKIVKKKSPLSWETRLKIAVGAARGISHIHKQGGQNFVHGNIKSSNIFLNRQKYGIVSDVGLAKLTSPIKRPKMLTHGYYAPEVKDTGNVSQASDIYGFGVVLLELLSGKHSNFRYLTNVTTLAAWTQSVVQSVARDKWAARVFDSELVEHGNEETMIRVLEIAMDCVNVVPESRPRMSQVAKMLEEISGIGPEFEPDGTWDWEQPSLESRLEIVMEDVLPTLMP